LAAFALAVARLRLNLANNAVPAAGRVDVT